MQKKNTKKLVKWFYVILASLTFVAFQNFTSPIRALDNEYISIEKLKSGDVRLVFEKGRAQAILANLKNAKGAMIEKFIVDPMGKKRKVSVIIYRGKQISCSIQPQGLLPRYCWTILTKQGQFKLDEGEPALTHNSYLPITMPVYNPHLQVKQDILEFLQNRKVSELPVQDGLEVNLKLENAFFRMHNLKYAKLVDKDSSKNLRCSPATIDYRHLCSFTIGQSGQITAGDINL